MRTICRKAAALGNGCGSVIDMADRTAGGVSAYFGTQVRKERQKAGLSIRHLARITGIDDAHLGRIERGLRPPTAEIAAKLDEAFPKREGWFSEFYEESRSWVPPAFRIWAEHEDRARQLSVWSPYTIHGLLQTSDYAEALLETARLLPEAMAGRLKNRMDRQQRVLYRDEPPRCVFVVDVLSLCREVGSPAIMARQLRHLLEVAELPNVTMTVLPAIAHPCNESGFIIADGSVYAESAAAGGVYQNQTFDTLAAKFDTLRADCYRRSESLSIIKTLEETWASGVSPLTQVLTVATA